ncbi:hypothetical protein S245_008963, partial [Arachis hypogaea]
DEVLATTNKFSGTRDNFKSLIPKEWVHGDVLNLVATMLTMHEKEMGCQTSWYLPAVFSAKYLEDMLKYDSFYKYNTPFRPRILDFAFVDMLETGEQAPCSNDCGVWVATWMTNYRKTYSYTINVNHGTRMRLALDLILRPHNLMLRNAIKSANRNYNKYKQKESNKN